MWNVFSLLCRFSVNDTHTHTHTLFALATSNTGISPYNEFINGGRCHLMTGLCPAPVCSEIDCSAHVDMLKTHTHSHLKIRFLWCHKEACYLSKLSDLVLPSVLAGSLNSMCLWEAVNIGLTKYAVSCKSIHIIFLFIWPSEAVPLGQWGNNKLN